MTKVLMVFPKFNPNSFWSLKTACDIYGAKVPAPPLGLITVAAMLPADWTVRLIDRNCEELTDADINWADMVMSGGMLVQRIDTLKVIEWAHKLGKPVVVGGPDATSSPELYIDADFRVLGEAEGILSAFVEAWRNGARSGEFQAEKFKIDVTTTPIPRFELLEPKNYLYLGVQFSRGCPFTCEFCDIIELYGRVPRSKGVDQMLAELDALYASGYRGHVDFVDDNLIGNKKALKIFLPQLYRWQRKRGYPFKFSTEASINLADDQQLLQMMADANFYLIFVGIESPDTSTLVSAQKKQNTKRSLAESVHKIYAAGMFVTAGFIVGFDTEKEGVAEGMIECIEATSIPWCMVGLLTALPNTQLSRRLAKEGRLRNDVWQMQGDQCTAGLNFVTLRPSYEVLEDYKRVLENVYSPEAFFGRAREVSRRLRRPPRSPLPDAEMAEIEAARAAAQPTGFAERAKAKLRRVRAESRNARRLLDVMWRMTVQRPELSKHFWSVFVECAKKNPAQLESIITIMVVYLHLGSFAQFVIKELDLRIAAEKRGQAPAEVTLQKIA